MESQIREVEVSEAKRLKTLEWQRTLAADAMLDNTAIKILLRHGPDNALKEFIQGRADGPIVISSRRCNHGQF